jgi:spore germination cell wall hydrolase CwlJ-like protein
MERCEKGASGRSWNSVFAPWRNAGANIRTRSDHLTQAPTRPWHRKQKAEPRKRPLQLLAIVLATGSCSTMQMIAQESAPILSPQLALNMEPAAAEALLDPAAAPALSGDPAIEANAALPLAGPGTAAPSTLILASATPVAQMRALDCLAQAIYYEARSESEAGQRAVAQVVLNRMRHAAWPNSVCGVVYQGPMRVGGGCQFTFTCDGSLSRSPYGEDWARARRLASEALGGFVFEPVGLSTFYHANYVMPRWAPRLLKTAVIGAHLFYRLPGAGRGAFATAYAGVEPIARPNPILVRYARDGVATMVPDWLSPPAKTGAAAAAAAPARNIVADEAPVSVAPPVVVEDIQIRPEYRGSGQWRSDAPAAITGR